MISKSSLQAVRALTELAKLPEGQFAGAAVIARRINAPANYLGKLLQRLTASGILISQKGFTGGFRLGRDPEDISLYEIMTCLEDMERWSVCFMGNKKCNELAPCPMHGQWEKIRETNISFLKNLTLSQINQEVST